MVTCAIGGFVVLNFGPAQILIDLMALQLGHIYLLSDLRFISMYSNQSDSKGCAATD